MKIKYKFFKASYAAALMVLATMLSLFSGCNGNKEAGNSYVAEVTDIDLKINNTGVSLNDIPAYEGLPCVEINNNEPFFDEADKSRTDPFETYSELDSLGRCGVAYANICKELMPAGERGQIGHIKPSGWQTAKYNGYIEGNYLYNRCHLIGFQLAGENDNEKNLITGTRYMNCDGQLPYEDIVDSYVDKTGYHVLYRVTPIYEGDNLVASGVLTEGYSIEDDGGLKFCVYCYNVQPGIGIDYSNGDNWLIEGYTGEYSTKTYYATKTVKDYGAHPEQNKTQPEQGDTGQADGYVPQADGYVLNNNSMKFHKTDCSSVEKMAEPNRIYSSEGRDSIIGKGYSPCGICKP